MALPQIPSIAEFDSPVDHMTNRILSHCGMLIATAAFMLLANSESASDKPAANGERARKVIRAVGTLEPMHVAHVSADVAEKIVKIAADFSDRVEMGQILAENDTTPFELDLRMARAGLQRAHAELEQAKAKFDLSRNRHARAKEGFGAGYINAAETDALATDIKLAEAGMAIGPAAVAQSELAVKKRSVRLRVSVSSRQ